MSTYHNAERWRRADVREVRHTFYVTFKLDSINGRKFTTVLAANKDEAKFEARAKWRDIFSTVYSEKEWLKRGLVTTCGFERLAE